MAVVAIRGQQQEVEVSSIAVREKFAPAKMREHQLSAASNPVKIIVE